MRQRIGIATDPDLWRQFRIACLLHNTSASQALTDLMVEQLTRWREQALRDISATPARPKSPRKETDV
jgi:hypothetical protein